MPNDSCAETVPEPRFLRMNDVLIALVQDLMTSPWLYATLVALAAFDAFVPVVPSETLVIMAGVFVASAGPDFPLVVAAAAVGAFAGDHVSYLVGRGVGARNGRLPANSRTRAVFDWVQTHLTERAGVVLVAARFIPGGRTAATLTTGFVGFRLPRFSAFTALGTTAWAAYYAGIGYVGGRSFEAEPMKAVLLGIGIAALLIVAVEVIRHARRRSSSFDTVDDAGLVGDDRGLHAVASVEPAEDRAHVRLDRALN